MNSNLVIRQLLSALRVATTHLPEARMEVLAASKAAREWLLQAAKYLMLELRTALGDTK